VLQNDKKLRHSKQDKNFEAFKIKEKIILNHKRYSTKNLITENRILKCQKLHIPPHLHLNLNETM
jgi:hypothetical protein